MFSRICGRRGRDHGIGTADLSAGSGLDLIRWRRVEAATVEHSYRLSTNERAAEALPSRKLGTNAALFRPNVMPYDLLGA